MVGGGSGQWEIFGVEIGGVDAVQDKLASVVKWHGFLLERRFAAVAEGVLIANEPQETRERGLLVEHPGQFGTANQFARLTAQSIHVIVAASDGGVDGGEVVVNPDQVLIRFEPEHRVGRKSVVHHNHGVIGTQLFGSRDAGSVVVVEFQRLCVRIVETSDIAGDKSVQIVMMDDESLHIQKQKRRPILTSAAALVINDITRLLLEIYSKFYDCKSNADENECDNGSDRVGDDAGFFFLWG